MKFAFDETKSVDYNYEVGYLEGLRDMVLLVAGYRGEEIPLCCAEIRKRIEDQKEIIEETYSSEED